MNKSYFCVCYKNRRIHSKHYKLLFFTIKFTLCHIRSNIYILKSKLASHKQYLLSLLTSTNTKKAQAKQNIPHVFLLCLKRDDPQTLKSDSSKNPFLQCVCYCYSLLQWIFFILCDNWKALLFIILCGYFEIIITNILLLSLKPVFWRKFVFYALSPQ